MHKKILIVILTTVMLLSMTAYAQEPVYVPILLYHNVAEQYDAHQKLLNISPAMFTEQMQALNNAGYVTISYAQYQDYVEHGTPLPEKPIIIAFDDGYESNYTYAYPILKQFGMKATIFVITSTVGNQMGTYPHFTWEQAKEMEDSGVITIGSHSHSHRDFSTLTPEETIYEARMSKYLIESNLSRPCTLFAYPYGHVSDYSDSMVLAAGFEVLSRVGDKDVNRKEDGVTALKRLTIWGTMTGEQLLNHIEKNANLQ